MNQVSANELLKNLPKHNLTFEELIMEKGKGKKYLQFINEKYVLNKNKLANILGMDIKTFNKKIINPDLLLQTVYKRSCNNDTEEYKEITSLLEMYIDNIDPSYLMEEDLGEYDISFDDFNNKIEHYKKSEDYSPQSLISLANNLYLYLGIPTNAWTFLCYYSYIKTNNPQNMNNYSTLLLDKLFNTEKILLTNLSNKSQEFIEKIEKLKFTLHMTTIKDGNSTHNILKNQIEKLSSDEKSLLLLRLDGYLTMEKDDWNIVSDFIYRNDNAQNKLIDYACEICQYITRGFGVAVNI